MKTNLLISVLTVFALNACATVPRIYHLTEEKLDTDGSTTVQSHQVAYLPNSVKLNYPGYVIGIEKSPKELINGKPIYKVDPKAGEGVLDDLERIGEDSKLHFVSQIYKYKKNPAPESSCVIHSLYQDNNDYKFYKKCSIATINTQLEGAFHGSWDALKKLKIDLAEAVKKNPKEQQKNFTHAFVIIMGWNTPQLESYRNFNEIVSNLESVYKGEAFRPLVIGVTWPSFWESSWFDSLAKGFSYRNKANDADEIGLTWLGVLLSDTIEPIRDAGINITLIGHSFGARASSMAVCVGPAIVENEKQTYKQPRNLVDHFIALQGAFSINRFFSFDDADWFNESISYPKKCPGSKTSLFTASKNDSAVDGQFIAQMIGDDEVYKETADDSRAKDIFMFVKVDENGNFDERSFKKMGSKLLNYVEASKLIKHNMVGTGGGSHSDIYRKETACMIKNFISRSKQCLSEKQLNNTGE